MKRAGQNAWAFTLVEMLVVMAIIAILAGLIFPAISKAKEHGRGTVCLSNLHQAGLALQLYVAENDNRMPFMWDRVITTNSTPTNAEATMDIVLQKHLGSTNVLRCPSDPTIFKQTGSSYAWNSLLNGQDADRLTTLNLDQPHRIPVFLDKEAFHIARGKDKGVNFLYADGHLRNLFEREGTR